MAESYPLSVIIPARQAAGELKLCLEALLKNDLTNVEVLVVDDASDDSTAEVASRFSERLAESGASMACLILGRQLGPAGARNRGLEQAKNPYTLFLDADVMVPERTLEWIRESLDLYSHRSDVAGVLGSYSETLPWDDFLSNFKNLCVCFLYEKTDTLSPYLHTPIFCVRREILEQVGGFDPQFATGEDFRLGIVLGFQGYRFVIDRKIKGVHLKRYTLRGVLKEDWQRVRDLRSIPLTPEEKRFAWRAHRLHRLFSLIIPGPVLLLATLSLGASIFGRIALILLLLFFLCNLPFLLYCARRRGWSFCVLATCFLFIEMLWAEIALAVAIIRR